MITNKMFRWIVVKDNFLDKQICKELIKYCDVGDSKNTELSKKYNIDFYIKMDHYIYIFLICINIYCRIINVI